MSYHKNHYILEYWNKQLKKFQVTQSSKNIEFLKKLASKSYYNYQWMGKKRIRKLTTETVWTSKT